MTRTGDYSLPAEVVELLVDQGLDALPEMIRVVINATMQAEREQYLGASPYERTEARQGYANGYKPKTVTTRVGRITFDVPQTRDGGFYPQALEKGLRSERALTAALAEMYVQGVSTRRVAAITEKLCGVAEVAVARRPVPRRFRIQEGLAGRGILQRLRLGLGQDDGLGGHQQRR